MKLSKIFFLNYSLEHEIQRYKKNKVTNTYLDYLKKT